MVATPRYSPSGPPLTVSGGSGLAAMPLSWEPFFGISIDSQTGSLQSMALPSEDGPNLVMGWVTYTIGGESQSPPSFSQIIIEYSDDGVVWVEASITGAFLYTQADMVTVNAMSVVVAGGPGRVVRISIRNRVESTDLIFPQQGCISAVG